MLSSGRTTSCILNEDFLLSKVRFTSSMSSTSGRFSSSLELLLRICSAIKSGTSSVSVPWLWGISSETVLFPTSSAASAAVCCASSACNRAASSAALIAASRAAISAFDGRPRLRFGNSIAIGCGFPSVSVISGGVFVMGSVSVSGNKDGP